MTRAQALGILGLEPGADDAAVREAHRRLISLVHPDHGGSGFLAAQVNRARDLLLGRRRR
jgi:curved DNA-binding protein CbpA